MENEEASLVKNEVYVKFYHIDSELYYCKDLLLTDCFVFAVINGLDGPDNCWACNKYVADTLDISEVTVSKSIARLVKYKFVKKVSFDGRKRVLKINPDYKKIHADALNEVFIEKKLARENWLGHGIGQDPNEEYKPKVPFKQTRKTVEAVEAPEEIKTIIKIWEDGGLRKTRKVELYNKIVKDLIKLKKGTYFNNKPKLEDYHDREFTQAEIVEAIDNFTLAAINPFCDPPPSSKYKKVLKGHSLRDFLYNTLNRDSDKLSLFIYYLENKPKTSSHALPKIDENPEYTKLIIKEFLRITRSGREPESPFSTADENKFMKASEKLKRFFDVNKRKLASPVYFDMDTQVKVLLKAILFDIGDNENALSMLTPGWLCSDLTFDKRLPVYMKTNNIFK